MEMCTSTWYTASCRDNGCHPAPAHPTDTPPLMPHGNVKALCQWHCKDVVLSISRFKIYCLVAGHRCHCNNPCCSSHALTITRTLDQLLPNLVPPHCTQAGRSHLPTKEHAQPPSLEVTPQVGAPATRSSLLATWDSPAL